MKTTLRLDDDLLREAKRRAVDEGTTLTHVVEEALRAALTRQPPREPYRLEWVTVKGDRPPAVDVADRNALYDFMDDE